MDVMSVTNTSQELPFDVADLSHSLPGKHPNLVLIGMPGAGKSTLGVVLAKILNYNFMDCDLLIQRCYNQTLQEIINERGIDGFLAVENEVLAGIECEYSIISTGGSAVYSDEAMRHLGEIGTIVYLKIGPDQLEKRLGDLQARGVVLRDGIGMGLQDLYDERQPLYEAYAEIVVEVDDLNITDAAYRVIRSL